MAILAPGNIHRSILQKGPNRRQGRKTDGFLIHRFCCPARAARPPIRTEHLQQPQRHAAPRVLQLLLLWTSAQCAMLPLVHFIAQCSGSGVAVAVAVAFGVDFGAMRHAPLVRFLACLLAVALARQRLLHALLFTWLQVKRVPLHFLDNVFRLHFALETTESIFQRLAFLDSNFSQWG